MSWGKGIVSMFSVIGVGYLLMKYTVPDEKQLYEVIFFHMTVGLAQNRLAQVNFDPRNFRPSKRKRSTSDVNPNLPTEPSCLTSSSPMRNPIAQLGMFRSLPMSKRQWIGSIKGLLRPRILEAPLLPRYLNHDSLFKCTKVYLQCK